jgi:hypothetical protein
MIDWLRETSVYDTYRHLKYLRSKRRFEADYVGEIRRRFEEKTGRVLELNRPVEISDKLTSYMMSYEDNLVTQCCDKLKVRDFVADYIGDQYLNELLGVYTRFEDVPFTELPDKFALKVNHSSGCQLLCTDKSEIDFRKNRRRFNLWLKQNYFYWSGEWGYKGVEPRIIAEEYLGDGIIDYKFYCFNGTPEFLYASQGLTYEHTLKVGFYDLDFTEAPFQRKDYPFLEGVEKPDSFDEMIELAAKLAKPFPFVRVDFFNVGERIIFSELTFYPNGGVHELHPQEYNRKIGDLLEWEGKEKKNAVAASI